MIHKLWKLKTLFLFLSVLLMPLTGFGQFKGYKIKKSPPKKPEAVRLAYVGTSANTYKGDLHDTYQKWTSALHIGFKLNHKTRFNGNINLSIGSIVGQNPFFISVLSEPNVNAHPNKFFRTNFIGFNYDLHFNLIKKPDFIIYLSQGLGIIRFNPTDEDGASLQKQVNTRLDDEFYGNTALMLPSGIGFIYFFPNHFAAGLQGGVTNPLTDYLDNISSLGPKKGNDNILTIRFSFFVPLSVVKPKEFDR